MNKNILIVDDVELSREILKNAILKIEGKMNIYTATNAYDAIDKMHNTQFDLVIMDIMMPNGDGFELLSMMSSKDLKSKIIIISSLDKSIVSSVSMLGKLYSLKINSSLKKPIIVDKISMLVSKALHDEIETTISSISGTSIVGNEEEFPITLVYQPQFISDINIIVGFEILSRWSDTDGSLLPPSFFLPIIEELDKKKVFMEIVVNKFIKDYFDCFCHSEKSIRFSMNVDPNLLLDDEVIKRLLAMYDDGLEHTIVIELSNKSLSDKISKELLANILRLRLRGFEISIDNVGGELSYIERITKMPINEIKINKETTWSFSHNTDVMEYIEKIKQMSIVKNARVIFEGVDNVELKEELEKIGSYLQQGFLHGVPVLPNIALKQLDEQAKLHSYYESLPFMNN